jgi:hypothetical protein
VPGHSSFQGNIEADKLANMGADRITLGPEPHCFVASNHIKSELQLKLINKAKQQWLSTKGQTHSKALITGFDKNKSNVIINLNRDKIRTLVRILTGHCRLNKHLCTMQIGDMHLCRFCLDAHETPIHLITECAPLMKTRIQIFGEYLIDQKAIIKTNPHKLINFFQEIGLGEDI